MGFRRSGRAAVVKILYSLEFREEDKAETPTPPPSADTISDAALDYWKSHKGSKNLMSYTEDLLNGVLSKQEKIDSLISEASDNWEIDRLPYIDKNILRLAIFELLEREDIPTPVIIDEAVELAKEYAGSESSSFINGILGKIQIEVRSQSGGTARR
jgi:N utilization substance protein B